ncbi:kinase-like protein [Amniculicola lignicola CBS 123094]|uniref:Kinase-like protein n=1 Tax=Amniculicola lignicola CBS 123094 TaxID=1392246 RepID=A0A6A5VVA2_9PLEO|nr:kinase-like protein [Amniculicola lignicola CBS 123094]
MCKRTITFTRFYGCGDIDKEEVLEECADRGKPGHITTEYVAGSGKSTLKCGKPDCKKGRTAIVYRVKGGNGCTKVCKMPRGGGSKRLLAEIDNAFMVEKKLLQRLGDHPRIVQYYGSYSIEGMKDGLLLGEANCGDLQSYIDKDDSEIDDAMRRKWSLQIAEAVAYVHEKGIIHSNLSTTNVLVHKAAKNPDLILADFGGSRCRELGLDGNLIPDEPFCDPHLTTFDSPRVDTFSVGVIIYIIMTGHYPFHQRPAPQNLERFTSYGDHVRMMFDHGKFPNLSGVPFGDVIAGCCCERRFEDANEVLAALKVCKFYSPVVASQQPSLST